ncbi:MAG: hypothetical protein FJ206_11100 [Gemmatimonadetes bacterium]|nr:hypothetical protein [Gemmatimonadota bacterium]
MRERIDLGPILREAVPTPYCHLVTRPTGATVRGRVEERIDQSPHPTTQLDFSQIGLIDFSCADEVVAKLLLRPPGERPRFVVLVNVSDSHLDAIEQVLETHQLTVMAVPAERATPCILGWRTPDLVTAFEAVNKLGAGDTGRLADLVGWTIERAADALQSLALRGLIQAASGTFRPLPTA